MNGLVKILIAFAFFVLWLGALPYMPNFVTVQISNIVTVIFVLVLMYFMLGAGIEFAGNWG